MRPFETRINQGIPGSIYDPGIFLLLGAVRKQSIIQATQCSRIPCHVGMLWRGRLPAALPQAPVPAGTIGAVLAAVT